MEINKKVTTHKEEVRSKTQKSYYHHKIGEKLLRINGMTIRTNHGENTGDHRFCVERVSTGSVRHLEK